jgi:hypothetical protein
LKVQIGNKWLIDPADITEADLPMVVFSSQAINFISWLIRWKTKGEYNHVMFMITPDTFASQGLTFDRVNIKEYLKPFNKMKFYKFKNLPAEKRIMLYDIINKRLALPWHKRRYDFLGIIGQALGIRWLNNPWMFFCSEQVVNDLKQAKIMELPAKANPEEINEMFKKRDDVEYYGHWWND